MISRPLFRLGDFATVYNDLHAYLDYEMIHCGDIHNCTTPSMRELANTKVVIVCVESCEQYRVNCDVYHWTDNMFVEGRRIAKYLQTGDDIG